MPHTINEPQARGGEGQERPVMIDARDIVKSFGANRVLHGVSLTLRKGEVVAVIGPVVSAGVVRLRLWAWRVKSARAAPMPSGVRTTSRVG